MYFYYRSLQVIWNRVIELYGQNTNQDADKLALSHTKGLLDFPDLIQCAGLNKFECDSDKDVFETKYRILLDWSVDGVEIKNAKDLLYHCWLQWIDPSDYGNLNELLEPALTSFERLALEDLTGLEYDYSEV